MGYSLLILPDAKRDLASLDLSTRARILSRLEWLAENAEQVVHHQLHGTPEDLAGLCRFRVGDYRILYWKKDALRRLDVFRIRHRSKAYRHLR